MKQQTVRHNNKNGFIAKANADTTMMRINNETANMSLTTCSWTSRRVGSFQTNSKQICMAARIVGAVGKGDTTSHDAGVEIVANTRPAATASTTTSIRVSVGV